MKLRKVEACVQGPQLNLKQGSVPTSWLFCTQYKFSSYKNFMDRSVIEGSKSASWLPVVNSRKSSFPFNVLSHSIKN